MTVAIVMGGGTPKGAFEVGDLKYLYEVTGVRPDILCGASGLSVHVVLGLGSKLQGHLAGFGRRLGYLQVLESNNLSSD